MRCGEVDCLVSDDWGFRHLGKDIVKRELETLARTICHHTDIILVGTPDLPDFHTLTRVLGFTKNLKNKYSESSDYTPSMPSPLSKRIV